VRRGGWPFWEGISGSSQKGRRRSGEKPANHRFAEEQGGGVLRVESFTVGGEKKETFSPTIGKKALSSGRNPRLGGGSEYLSGLSAKRRGEDLIILFQGAEK